MQKDISKTTLQNQKIYRFLSFFAGPFLYFNCDFIQYFGVFE